MWTAKPYLSSNRALKKFKTAEEAVDYLEKYTGIKMSYEYNRKTKVKIYDWELVDKLFLSDTSA